MVCDFPYHGPGFATSLSSFAFFCPYASLKKKKSVPTLKHTARSNMCPDSAYKYRYMRISVCPYVGLECAYKYRYTRISVCPYVGLPLHMRAKATTRKTYISSAQTRIHNSMPKRRHMSIHYYSRLMKNTDQPG